jgi:hypothetical protein
MATIVSLLKRVKLSDLFLEPFLDSSTEEALEVEALTFR